MLVNDTSTTSKRSIWPEETRGLWVIRALDSSLLLSNEMLYDDWASALGANTLGYSRFRPDNCRLQPAASLPWQIERDFAIDFCAAMGTEAVRFFKTGSDAMACGVRLARAYTERPYILVFDKCYHGNSEVFQPIIWTQTGYPDMPYTIKLPFGEEVRSGLLDKCAAIVVEPAPKAIELPPLGWLQHLREVCDEHGIILISDEIILGYRSGLRGFLDGAGVAAELRCYGKAMGQGAAISACTGNRNIMELLSKEVHFSGTNNGEPTALYIASETLKTYQQEDVCKRLGEKGARLRALLSGAGFKTRGLNQRFEVELEDKIAAVRYCFSKGILFPGWCSMALTHEGEQIDRLVTTLTEWRDSYGK